MTNSQNANTNCFSGILSRLLCTNSLPTHPSDRITESITTTKFIDPLKKDPPNTESKLQISSSSTKTTTTAPGIVARLMGLETLAPDTNWVPKTDTFARSRSVNFMDYLIQFNNKDQTTQAQHHRVRTSVSFREVPRKTELNQQNHEYFVFYLENVDGSKELGSKQRKAEMGIEELDKNEEEREKGKKMKEKKREKVGVKKKVKGGFKGKDETMKVVYSRNCSKVADFNGVYRKHSTLSKVEAPLKPVGSKFTEKKKVMKSRKTVKEAEHVRCHSKNSSPVSVLENRHGSPLSDDQKISCPRKKSLVKARNSNYQSPHFTRASTIDELELEVIKSKGNYESLKITGEAENYVKLLNEIGKLTEIDMKECYWIKELFRFEDFDFVFVKDFRVGDVDVYDSAIQEAKSLNAIRTALENLEDQLEFFHTVQIQQRAERDAAIARLEQSRIVLAMRLSEHQGKNYQVIEEALAFVGDVHNTAENLYGSPTNPSGNNFVSREGNRSNFLMKFLISSFNIAKNSLKLDHVGGILGNAALVAVSMLALLHLQQVGYKDNFDLESPQRREGNNYSNINAKRNSRLEGSSGRRLSQLDVMLARG